MIYKQSAQSGVPPLPSIGGGRFGWKFKAGGPDPTRSRVWFVDGNVGSDAYDGADPETAFATVGKAISVAAAYDVIYVLDKGLSGTDPNPYREATANLSIPYAKNNLALVGVPHNIHDTYGLQIKAALALTTPILSVSAPFVAIENLDLNGTGDALARGNIYFADDSNTTNQAQGGSVYNCHIRNGKGVGGVGTVGGGITIVGGWYYTIKECRFERCRVGIWISGSAHEVKGVRVEDNLFTSDDLAIVDQDIYMIAAVNATTICENCFAHDKGTYNQGTPPFATLVGSGVLCKNTFAHAAVVAAHDGADLIIPDTFLMAGNYDEAGLILRGA